MNHQQEQIADRIIPDLNNQRQWREDQITAILTTFLPLITDLRQFIDRCVGNATRATKKSWSANHSFLSFFDRDSSAIGSADILLAECVMEMLHFHLTPTSVAFDGKNLEARESDLLFQAVGNKLLTLFKGTSVMAEVTETSWKML